jgi:excisionase family DNA binding protein
MSIRTLGDPVLAAAAEMFEGGALDVAGAAAEFSVSRSVLYELMQSGRLAYAQVGRKRLIARRALAELLAQSAVGVKPAAAGGK